MKYSKYFGAKWSGFIKSESILAPKGASQIKYENIRCDTLFAVDPLPLCRYRHNLSQNLREMCH